MKKRIVGVAIGLVYAVFCGFISLGSTGGGHDSFMWLFLFVIPELCGVYFVLMGFLAVDLHSSRFRWIFGVVLAVNIIISAVMIGGSFTSDPYTIMAWNSQPLEAVFITAIHIVPSLIFTAILVVSVVIAKPAGESITPTILS